MCEGLTVIRLCLHEGKPLDLLRWHSPHAADLMLSGPVGAHAEFWQQLSKGPNPIDLDEPEPLDKFLSRVHGTIGVVWTSTSCLQFCFQAFR